MCGRGWGGGEWEEGGEGGRRGEVNLFIIVFNVFNDVSVLFCLFRFVVPFLHQVHEDIKTRTRRLEVSRARTLNGWLKTII